MQGNAGDFSGGGDPCRPEKAPALAGVTSKIRRNRGGRLGQGVPWADVFRSARRPPAVWYVVEHEVDDPMGSIRLPRGSEDGPRL
jgi:hypothetical protein